MKDAISSKKLIHHDTELVQAVTHFSRTRNHRHTLQDLIHRAQQARHYEDGLDTYDGLIRARLAQAVFVGHINTDLDSVAGAIGAAALFGGVPAISEPVESLNGEIRFALDNCGIETPRQFDLIEEAGQREVVLVDHTEEKQMVPSILRSPNRATRIIGVLDHHALARTFFSSRPIFMDVRPWGSASTIIAVLFIHHKKCLPQPLALLLLQAILSDTLNLRSVTTTEADRGMVALLSDYARIGNTRRVDQAGDPNAALTPGSAYLETEIDSLAERQFQAKTDWIVALGAYEMVRGDQKDFSCGPWKFGISVLEVTDASSILEHARDILLELRLLKKEKGLSPVGADPDDALSGTASTAGTDGDCSARGMALHRQQELDFAFLFVVNIATQQSILLIPGGRELALARAAFLADESQAAQRAFLTEASPGIAAPGATIKPAETALHLPPGWVSRKAQFVPALCQALERNFSYAAKGPVSLEDTAGHPYSAADTAQLLRTIERSKRAGTGSSADESNEEAQRVFQREALEDRALLARETALAADADGNWYAPDGRIRRSYRH